jgi:hypothetical protein
MRTFLGVLAALVLVLTPTAAGAANGQHKHKHKKADLVVSLVQGTISGRQVTVQLVVKNHGKKKAKASSTGVYLSADVVHDAGDVTLGQLPAGKLKPGKSAAAQGVLTVPEAVPAGSFYVIACADVAAGVKEKKETNNCLASPTTVSFVPPVLARVSFSTTGCCGQVTGQVTPASSGSCDATSCALTHVPATVVLTAIAGGGAPTFGDWSGATCDGSREYFIGDSGGTVTFTNLSTDKQCTAGFFGG